MPILESNYYGLWWGKQTARGTPQVTPTHRGVMVGGDLATARDDGEENFSDLTKYGARTEWVNSILGNGEPVLEATPTELAHLLWLFHGSESVAAEAAVIGPPAIPAMSRHRFVPSTGLGHPFTAYVRVGSSVIRRHRYNDSYITRLAIEASTANKAMRVTPRILSLDPGEVFAADPLAALPADRPFLHTDLSQVGGAASATIDGSLSIDGITFRGVTQFSVVIDDAYEPVFGDDSRPYDLVQGQPNATVGATVYADAAGLARFNHYVYGSATPAAGTKPQRGIAALGSFKATMRQRDAAGAHSGREFVGDFPAIKWTVPDAPGPNPDGGTAEIALAGTMRPPASGSAYTLDVRTASTVTAFT